MLTTDLALLADAHERIGTLKVEVEHAGMAPATDRNEAVKLGMLALRCDLARQGILDVLILCQVYELDPQATRVLDRLLKGRE